MSTLIAASVVLMLSAFFAGLMSNPREASAWIWPCPWNVNPKTKSVEINFTAWEAARAISRLEEQYERLERRIRSVR